MVSATHVVSVPRRDRPGGRSAALGVDRSCARRFAVVRRVVLARSCPLGVGGTRDQPLARTQDMDRILLVLTDGDLVWDPSRGDFDADRSPALPPALLGRFGEEPRHLDLRWARGEEQLDLRHRALPSGRRRACGTDPQCRARQPSKPKTCASTGGRYASPRGDDRRCHIADEVRGDLRGARDAATRQHAPSSRIAAPARPTTTRQRPQCSGVDSRPSRSMRCTTASPISHSCWRSRHTGRSRACTPTAACCKPW